MSSADQGSPEEPRRPGSLVSLLGSGEEPSSSDLRADPLASSEHSRHGDLAPPREDFDLGRARAVCAEIARLTLLDFTPGLLLLEAPLRLRAQALIAYTRTLFDFINDHGLAGEPLAQINRWQFALDQSLEEEPVGQPIFVCMAALNAPHPWRREVLDQLASLARGRISHPPANTADLHRQLKSLAAAGVSLLFGTDSTDRLEEIGAALFRAHSLACDSSELALLRPDLTSPAAGGHRVVPPESLRRERTELTRLLQVDRGDLADLPKKARRAVLYACYAARIILEPAEASAPQHSVTEHRARIGAWKRLRLVLRARWRG